MIFRLLLCVVFGSVVAHASELEKIEQVKFVETDWADGDSFRVQFPDGKEHTLRLYGADCIEWHVTDDSDARRLRAQRRYFGISKYGGSSQASIELAKSEAGKAAEAVREILKKPFTVYTSFADGRGSAKYKRIYAFVETSEGHDLSTWIVQNGFARAYGVYRSTPDGLTQDEYREQLKDAELVAVRKGAGTWAYTDWEALPSERQAQRMDDREEQIAMGKTPLTGLVDINTASRDELMAVPGIGEVTANRIIEARPYKSIDELTRVSGIGSKTLEKFRPYLGI
ncbi:MAG: helix-hairpin-helix domain-containing protein [Verrucomicrobiota bacterium]